MVAHPTCSLPSYHYPLTLTIISWLSCPDFFACELGCTGQEMWYFWPCSISFFPFPAFLPSLCCWREQG